MGGVLIYILFQPPYFSLHTS